MYSVRAPHGPPEADACDWRLDDKGVAPMYPMGRHHYHYGWNRGWRPFWFMPFGFLMFPLMFFLFFGLFKFLWPLLLIGLGIAMFKGWSRHSGGPGRWNWDNDWNQKWKHDWDEKPKHDWDDKPKRGDDEVIIV
jgi:hypothetical protein